MPITSGDKPGCPTGTGAPQPPAPPQSIPTGTSKDSVPTVPTGDSGKRASVPVKVLPQ